MTRERMMADRLLRHINEATPGGIHPQQFRPLRHPVKAVFAAFPFLMLVVLVIVAIATRHP